MGGGSGTQEGGAKRAEESWFRVKVPERVCVMSGAEMDL